MNNLPVSESEEMMPYIKQHKKSTASKIVFLFAVVAIVAAICITAFRSSSGKLKEFISGFFGKTDGSSNETTTGTETTTGEIYDSLYYFDASLVPEGEHGVIPCDLSVQSQGKAYDNKASLEIDSAQGELASADDGKIRVLIVCTHPFEAYSADVITSYGADFSASGGDDTVAVLARELARKLIALGIGAEYLDTGVTSGRNSYSDAAKVISEYLSSHEEIVYIIDLHRATLLDSSLNLLRPVTEKDNTVYAQMKLVVGSDYDGWENGLLAANTLYAKLSENNSSLLMPTEINESRLNQHLDATVFTVEIGTCANSFEEAQNTVGLFALVFSQTVGE